MADVLQTINSNGFLKEKICSLKQLSLEFLPKGPAHYNSALVQVMAWRQAGETVLDKTYDAIWG